MPKHHDPLCPRSQWPGSSYINCQCNLIHRVGERIEKAIRKVMEADPDPDTFYGEGAADAFDYAARIAARAGLDAQQ